MFILRRLVLMVPLLLMVSFLAFLLIRMVPGGPFDKDRAPASPEIQRNLEAKYHLDEPFIKQYVRFLAGLVRGDFGPSLKYRNHSVNDIIRQGLPVSLTLGALAFGVAWGIGIPLGFISAVKKKTWMDSLGSFLALMLICVPAFVMGPVLILLFAVKNQIFPVALWETPSHVVLPTFTLGLFFSGRVARLMKEGMLNILESEFITTARAKGLGETEIFLKHGLRIAVLPVISYSGSMLADLLTGSFVVENIFQIPGIGVYMVNSSLSRDYTMVVGLVVLYAFLLMVLNLVVDVMYCLFDPRVRHEA